MCQENQLSADLKGSVSASQDDRESNEALGMSTSGRDIMFHLSLTLPLPQVYMVYFPEPTETRPSLIPVGGG